MARTSLRAASSLALVVVLCVASVAWAGGMTLPGRGARALGRAGSFVAGADDGGAMSYNPAGLGEIAGWSILLDAGLVLQRVSYARIDSGGNPHPPVDGTMEVLPIPTLSITHKPRKVPWLTVGGGLWAPYLGVNSWPENGPQRYSSITLKGSLLAVLQFSAAFRVHQHVYLGVGLQNMFLRFKSRVMLHTCTGLSCAPEDPGFDALTEVDAFAGFTPSGIVGLTVAYPKWRVGLGLQLPFFVRASGNVHSRLPTDPMFAGVELRGSAVDLSFELPVILRVGGEWRPLETLRIELGLDYEAWSMQDRLTIQPKGIYLTDVPGIGDYHLSAMHVPRKLIDSVAVHLGGEWEVWKRRLALRAGYLFETSATPDETMSVLIPDGWKNMITFGLGGRVGPVRLDLGYAHVFYTDRDVTHSEATQLNPIQPPLPAAVGHGLYRIDADVLSVGLDARF